MNDLSIVVALGAGILSFISPCVLPMVPVYLASLCGPELLEKDSTRKRFPVFLHSLSFVLGLGIVFTLLGAGAGLLGFSLSEHLGLIRKIAGSLLIFFGVFMLAGTKIPWLNFTRALPPVRNTNLGYLRSLLTGGAFAFAWTPCSSPILGSIVALAWSSETAGQGAYLLAFYSLGLGIPFLIIGAAFGWVNPLLKFLQRYSNIVYLISACLLIAAGILTLLNKLAIFS